MTGFNDRFPPGVDHRPALDGGAVVPKRLKLRWADLNTDTQDSLGLYVGGAGDLSAVIALESLLVSDKSGAPSARVAAARVARQRIAAVIAEVFEGVDFDMLRRVGLEKASDSPTQWETSVPAPAPQPPAPTRETCHPCRCGQTALSVERRHRPGEVDELTGLAIGPANAVGVTTHVLLSGQSFVTACCKAQIHFKQRKSGDGMTWMWSLAPVFDEVPATAGKHVVRAGETPHSIAMTYTGNGNRYPELVAVNVMLQGPSPMLHVSQVLALPATWRDPDHDLPIEPPTHVNAALRPDDVYLGNSRPETGGVTDLYARGSSCVLCWGPTLSHLAVRNVEELDRIRTNPATYPPRYRTASILMLARMPQYRHLCKEDVFLGRAAGSDIYARHSEINGLVCVVRWDHAVAAPAAPSAHVYRLSDVQAHASRKDPLEWATVAWRLMQAHQPHWGLVTGRGRYVGKYATPQNNKLDVYVDGDDVLRVWENRPSISTHAPDSLRYIERQHANFHVGLVEVLRHAGLLGAP